MRPPTLPHLLALNACVGGGSYLTIVTATKAMTEAGWGAGAQGTALFAANLCYGGLVLIGGQMADRIGRARTALIGAAVLLASIVVGLTPLAVDGIAGTSAVAATMLSLAGCAFFFPGTAGLFSDARGAEASAPVPLHVKVSRYNIGWSSGNLAGIALGWSITELPWWTAFAAAGAAYLFVVASLWAWRSLPPHPPAAEGDRAPHPALARLTFAGRATLLLWCLIGMATITLATVTISTSSGGDAQGRDRLLLVAYAIGYVLTFAVLGRWGGWVLRPWRLTALIACGLPGIAGLLVLGQLGGLPAAWALFACGLSLGVGFAAVYTGSLYYSLRAPGRAGSAAGVHETYLGVGSTAAPLLAGWFVQAMGNDLSALGLWLCIGFAAVIACQVVLIPAAARLCRMERST